MKSGSGDWVEGLSLPILREGRVEGEELLSGVLENSLQGALTEVLWKKTGILGPSEP